MRRATIAVLLLLTACSGGESEAPSSTAATTTSEGDRATTTQPEGGFPFQAIPPHFGADGNRVANATGPFGTSPSTERMRETRVVRVDLPTDDVVAITYDDGEVRLIDAASAMKFRQTEGATGIVYTDGPGGVDIFPLLSNQALHSRPAVLPNGQIAYVTEAGELVIWDSEEIARIDIDALPDGDVLVDDGGRILVLTGPTDRYPHAILGDEFEASGFAILEPPELIVASRVTVAEPGVIEARRAQWTDFDGDGQLEVQVTVSDSSGGARLVVYDEAGNVEFEGAPIGRSNRWRHQIAFGTFGGKQLGVEVVTPHIGGIVAFNEYGPDIARVARKSDFTSHAIGSRELDGGVAIDIDGDGNLELVLPSQDRRTLVAIGIVDGKAKVVWRSGLGGRLSSNIAVGTRDGVPTIAVGTANGTVLFWSGAA